MPPRRPTEQAEESRYGIFALCSVVDQATNVAMVLSRPLFALLLFVIGIGLFLVANQQVKMVLTLLENNGIQLSQDEGTAYTMSLVLIFLMMYLDLLLYSMLKNIFHLVWKRLFRAARKVINKLRCANNARYGANDDDEDDYDE